MYLQMIDMLKQLSAFVISNDSYISHRNVRQSKHFARSLRMKETHIPLPSIFAFSCRRLTVKYVFIFALTEIYAYRTLHKYIIEM